jgi:hypothetical protein
MKRPYRWTGAPGFSSQFNADAPGEGVIPEHLRKVIDDPSYALAPRFVDSPPPPDPPRRWRDRLWCATWNSERAPTGDRYPHSD